MSEENINLSKDQNAQQSVPQNAPQFREAANDLPTQLPNSTGALVLGILSIVLACCTIIGAVLGIIALVQAKKSRELWESNPGAYTESSYKNANAGKICAIIGLCISGLALVYWIFYFVVFGTIFGAAMHGAASGFPY